jgi:uncharacterized protein YndB with AHSA1/START domain
MLGVLDEAQDGLFVLRFDRTYPRSQAKVWHTIIDRNEFSRWFDQWIDYDASSLNLTEGARLSFVAHDSHLLPTQSGEVIRADPPHLLEFTRASQLLRWQLTADGGGACRLTLTVTDDWRNGLTASAPRVHAMLDALRARLFGARPPTPDLDKLRRTYERAFG